MNGAFAVALAAGMAATINPCGFALLPAYLSTFVGLKPDQSRAAAVRRALTVSGALTAGFIAVFGLFGAIVTPLALQLERYLPWVTIVVGISLLGLGIALLKGREFTVKIPKLDKGGTDGTIWSMFLFGVSYAIASLSCTIGPFLAVTSSTFRSGGWIEGLAVFITYGLGMGLVIAILTVAVALAKNGIVRHLRELLPLMNRIAGVLLILAGAYVAYYGWYEISNGGNSSDPIVGAASKVQGWLVAALLRLDPWLTAGIGAMVLALMVVASGVLKRRRDHTRRDDEGTSAPAQVG